MGLAIERQFRQPLLICGIAFHAGIIFVHGLGSFFCAMAGALLIYLRSPSEPFCFERMRGFQRKLFARASALTEPRRGTWIEVPPDASQSNAHRREPLRSSARGRAP